MEYIIILNGFSKIKLTEKGYEHLMEAMAGDSTYIKLESFHTIKCNEYIIKRTSIDMIAKGYSL